MGLLLMIAFSSQAQTFLYNYKNKPVKFEKKQANESGKSKFMAQYTEKAATGAIDSLALKTITRSVFNKNKGLAFDSLYWDLKNGYGATGLTGIASRQSGVLSTEWFSDKMGSWRISAGSVLGVGADTVLKTFQEFTSGGGNLYIKFLKPLLDISSTKHQDKRYFKIFLAPKAGASILNVGSTKSDSARWNLDFGSEFHLKIAGDEGKIAMYSIYKTGYVFGSKEFSRLLTSNGRRAFGYASASVGVIFDNKLSVSFDFPVNLFGNLNDPIDKTPLIITLSILTLK